MKATKIFTILVLGLIFCLAQVSEATPMGTAWTYQGRLMDKNKPAEGSYGFKFTLYDANDPCTANQLGSPIDINDVDVIDGHFVVELDFGSEVFDGNAVWLETTVVRSPMGSDPAVLRPLMELTPTPYALQTRGMFVDPNRNVGIGTTSPLQKLHIADSGMTSLFVHDTADNVIGQLQADHCSVSVQSIYNHPLRFSINDIERLYIDTTGNVGIGMTSPKASLDINGSFYFLGGSGDVTGNGSLGGLDSSYIMQYLSGTRFFSIRERSDADINGDGRIDTLDADLIAMVAVGSITLEDAHHDIGKFIADSSVNIDYNGNVGIGTAIPDEKLHVVGSVKIVDGNQGTNKVLTSDANGVGSWQSSPVLPRGVIVMWSGAINDIPNGWALCDGTNGTPNLRDRFIVGARQDVDGAAMTNVKGSLMQTGGEHQHTLTEAEMPAHTHEGRFSNLRDDSSGDDTTYYVNKGATSVSGSTGGNQPHENCPPFYALAFIMKL